MKPKRSRHHILHHRVEWTARPQAEQLRESPPLIPELEDDDHIFVHANAPAVPVLGVYALQHVNNLYVPAPCTFKSIDSLLLAIDKAGKHPRAHEIERSMGQLTIQAIEIQRAILKGIL